MQNDQTWNQVGWNEKDEKGDNTVGEIENKESVTFTELMLGQQQNPLLSF